MSTTIERARPKPLAPSIREVCLIGSRVRRYVHITPPGLRTQDSGLSSKRAISSKM